MWPAAARRWAPHAAVVLALSMTASIVGSGPVEAVDGIASMDQRPALGLQAKGSGPGGAGTVTQAKTAFRRRPITAIA